ncbi:enkurin [Entelurus aequoreus]|uniref:enkurin n=1 Tax=Entelurus aequoreus TaxID=161455 RepID=UPI002B1E0833|nr:enkurin [Entelurus aequoreus]
MEDTEYPEESIYNFLAEQVHSEKAKMYTSKYRPRLILEERLSKSTMKTMGPAKVDVPSPDKYLKKHSKEVQLPEKKECSRKFVSKKPPVPLRTERPPMGVHTKKNFMTTTVAATVKPQPACVDSSRGHRELLENSGLVPKYSKKKDYGEVPGYLQHRSEEEQCAVDEYNKYLSEQMDQGSMTQLSDEERQINLQRLKSNWAELHQEYQRLPVLIDTMARKARKLQLEAEMKQLESDIGLFEKFKTIYIAK